MLGLASGSDSREIAIFVFWSVKDQRAPAAKFP